MIDETTGTFLYA